VELSTPYLRQLAEEPPALAGLLLKNESKLDSSPPCNAVEVEEEIRQGAVEAVGVEEEAEERQLLCSPRPCLRQLSHKQLTSELWEPHQEYSKEIEQRQTTSSTNYDTTIASIEESPASIPP
jgi:hypothetical protein